jgi:hypothetical protein
MPHLPLGIEKMLGAWLGLIPGGLLESAFRLAHDLHAKREADRKARLVDTFINAQLEALGDMAFDLQQHFLTHPGGPSASPSGGPPAPGDVQHTKQQLREMERTVAGLGVATARDDLAELRAKRKTGDKAQFDASLTGWTVLLAHGKLGTKDPGEVENQERLGTDVSKIKSGVSKDTPGVLQVPAGQQFDHFPNSPNRPQSGPRLLHNAEESARLFGLGPELVKKLQERSSILEMGVPFVAKGTITLNTVDFATLNVLKTEQADFLFAISETGEPALPVVSNNRNVVERWLTLRANDGVGPDTPDAQKVREGLLLAMQQDIGGLAPQLLKVEG